MAVTSQDNSDYLEVLSSYSACDVSDALLKLQRIVPGEVPRAGYLRDLVPYAPSSPHSGSPSKQPKVIGPASTLKLVTKEYAINPLPASTPGAIPKGHHWVDLTDQGTIVVIEQPDGQSCAAIGGIMALRMKVKGAKGCVVGGRVRDLEELRNCGLPVWARDQSTVGAGAESKAFARNVDISIADIKISPGDIMFCDPLEGVVAIPRELLKQVVKILPTLVEADDRVKEEVRKGESVVVAFEKHRG